MDKNANRTNSVMKTSSKLRRTSGKPYSALSARQQRRLKDSFMIHDLPPNMEDNNEAPVEPIHLACAELSEPVYPKEEIITPITENTFQEQVLEELRKMNERLFQVEQRLARMEPKLEQHRPRTAAPTKPSNVPVRTMEDVLNFNKAEEEEYSNVVRYLEHLGGFNLREAVSLCVKELLSDDVAYQFTWWGKDTGHRPQCMPLHNTRLAQSIYEAVSSNVHFPPPTRTEFQAAMQEALRVAKQRKRNAARKVGPTPTKGERPEDSE